MKWGACGPRVGTGARLAEDDSLGDIRSLGATDAGDYSKGRLTSGVAFRDPKRPSALILGHGVGIRRYRESEKLSPALLVRGFEKWQTEGPERRTTPNVTNGPVPTVPSGSIFSQLRMGTELLSQLLR